MQALTDYEIMIDKQTRRHTTSPLLNTEQTSGGEYSIILHFSLHTLNKGTEKFNLVQGKTRT